MRLREKNDFRDRFEIRTLRFGDDSYLASRNPSFIACVGFGVGLSLSLPSPFSDRKTNKPITSYTIFESLQSRNSLSTILILFFLRFTQLHHRLYKCKALRSCYSLAMHFATFADSDFKALEPTLELEQAQ